ncbi:hypothetical protein [Methylobacterium sp. CM6247]
MSITPEMIDAMVAAGLTREQMAALMKASLAQAEAAQAEKRAKAAAKKRRQRSVLPAMSLHVPGTSGDTRGQLGTEGDNPAAPLHGPLSPPAPPLTPLNPPTTPVSPSEADASSAPQGARVRGTRLPVDFGTRPEARRACEEFGLTGRAIDEALAEFHDFWVGVPGVRGTKLDWVATLRNRLRETVRRQAPARASPMTERGNGFGHLAAQKRAARQSEGAHDHATERHTDRTVCPSDPRTAGAPDGDARGGYGDGPGQILDLAARRAYG